MDALVHGLVLVAAIAGATVLGALGKMSEAGSLAIIGAAAGERVAVSASALSRQRRDRGL